MRPILFVSDLHLSPTRAEVADVYFRFLATEAREAAALYILGDLFEYWIGDDSVVEPFNRKVADAIAATVAAGTPVYLMHGNRDFLIGKRLAAYTGMTLLPDPTLADLAGTPTLLMHGDTLCTDDVEYQRLRAKLRSRRWQRTALAMPRAVREWRAKRGRRLSEQRKRERPAALMDVNAGAVEEAFRAHGYPRMIHGHTHRPAHHVHDVDGHKCERWVLADWYQRGSYLRCDARGVESVPLG
jgi:UDP-2,3-diacylglucosamine hydrolase